MTQLSLSVNGQHYRVQVAPETPLLYVLRNDLGLKSVKFGCGLEQCGTCTVIVGAEALRCCKLPVGEVGDREVTTLEGLESSGRLHPLQQAFVDEQAAQCGYCIPGMIMAAAALLAWNAKPTDADIRRALADHLCRCGSYGRIIQAVRRAAGEMDR